MRSPTGRKPTIEEEQLVADVLRCPDFSHEAKGTRMKAIFECLWEFYKAAPDSPASEKIIANAVYSGMGEEDDSIVRRAISRLRRFLDRIAADELSDHSIRVRIPIRQYRLEFYYPYTTNGCRPVEWFWRSYCDTSIPVRLVLCKPKRQGIGFPLGYAATVLQRLAGTFGRDVEHHEGDFQERRRYRHEPESYSNFSYIEMRLVVAEEHGMWLGSYPQKVDPKYDCEVLRRKALELLGLQQNPLVDALPEITYAKLTRFTNPQPPYQQITEVDSELKFPLLKLVEKLTLDEFLSPLLTRPKFAAENSHAAPRKFQMLFSATIPPNSDMKSTEPPTVGLPEIRAVTLGPEYISLSTIGYPWDMVETRAL